jgi:hypothetical protein
MAERAEELTYVKAVHNKEPKVLPANEDDGMDRTYWRVACCPCAGSCCAASWKKGDVWSWESEVACLSYLAGHLHFSGKHFLGEEEAIAVAMAENTETHTSTYAEREVERKHELERTSWRDARPKSPETRRSRSPRRGVIGSRGSGGRSGGGGGGGGSGGGAGHGGAVGHPGHPNRRVGGKGGGGDANSGELREIKQSLNSVVDVLRNTAQAVAASASAAAGPLAAECTTALTARPRNILLTTSGSVTIPVTSVRMLITSIRQVRDAAERLVVLVPVLQASEDALNGLLQQQQGRN